MSSGVSEQVRKQMSAVERASKADAQIEGMKTVWMEMRQQDEGHLVASLPLAVGRSWGASAVERCGGLEAWCGDAIGDRGDEWGDRVINKEEGRTEESRFHEKMISGNLRVKYTSIQDVDVLHSVLLSLLQTAQQWKPFIITPASSTYARSNFSRDSITISVCAFWTKSRWGTDSNLKSILFKIKKNQNIFAS